MMSGKNVRKVWEERGSWREVEGLPAYESSASGSAVGGWEGERKGKVGVVMDEVGGGGAGDIGGEGLGVGQIM